HRGASESKGDGRGRNEHRVGNADLHREIIHPGGRAGDGSSVSGGAHPGEISPRNTRLASWIISCARRNGSDWVPPPAIRPISIHCSAHRRRVTKAKSLRVRRRTRAVTRSA